MIKALLDTWPEEWVEIQHLGEEVDCLVLACGVSCFQVYRGSLGEGPHIGLGLEISQKGHFLIVWSPDYVQNDI